MASEIAAPKPDLDAKARKDDFEALFKRNFKRKIVNTKIGKICWQITIAAWMQPLQYDLQSSAAKDNSITHAAAAPSNLDAATPMRSAETELQNTIELRAMASEIAAPKPDLDAKAKKKTILKHFSKGLLKGKLLAPKLGKSADKWISQPGCSHSNTIYNLQLQKTIVLRMQPRRQATFTQPLQCDLQAQIPKHPITTHTQAHPKQLEATVTLRQKKTINRPQPHPPHRRGTFHRRLQPRCTEKHKVSCSGFLPKTEPLQHHAAIPMRSASTDSKTPYNYAHTSTPKAAWSHRYTAAKKTINRPQPHPPHRRGTFHRRLQPLYTEKHKVSCSGFLPKTEPL